MSHTQNVHSYCFKRTFLSLCVTCIASSLMAKSDPTFDATTIPLEELVETKFIPASHIANQISNASSAVSIVTAQDIKDYGYRTLSQILASMKGLHVADMVSYGLVGGRGFPNNDYAGRIIVLIDGYRADDSYFGQAYLGNDSLLDVSLIERVEYIPGGGSAGYGDGALLGAINIITKKGSDIGGTQVALGFGKHQVHQQRVSVGETLDNGANLLISASAFSADNSILKKSDNDEKSKRFFAKYDAQNFSFLGAYAKRSIGEPTYNTASESFFEHADENAFLLFKYHTDIASHLKLSTSFWYGQYTYYSYFLNPLVSIDHGTTTAHWYGGDVMLIGTWFDNHTISIGTSYRNDYKWLFKDAYNDMQMGVEDVYRAEVSPRKTYSVYAYDDFIVTPTLSLNYGLRYENSNNSISYASPRVALIYKPWEETVFKLSAGTTNRQATPFDGGEWSKPEQAKTVELVVEQQLGWQTKLTGSLYQYRVSNRIDRYSLDAIETKGAEIEFEKHWDNGTRLKASYARQNANESDGEHLGYSPRNLAKVMASTPLFDNALRLGVEAHYTDKYLYYTGIDVHRDAYTMVNINLLARRIAPNLDVNFLVHDVFNKTDQEADTQLPQSGRTFWLEMEYTFK